MNLAPLTDLRTHARQWVTPRELSAYLDCDVRTILRMIDLGSLYAYKVGRNWRIPLDEAQRTFPPTRPREPEGSMWKHR